MSASWADVADSEKAASRAKPAYVPPHLRNRQSEPVAPLPQNDRPGYGGQPSRWAPGGGGGVGGGGGYRNDVGRPGQGYGGRVSGGGGGGGGWNNRGGGCDREANQIGDDADLEPAVQENTGMNFDAYEDIPIETSGGDVPPPVNTFADIDLGEALNLNIRRCKYVRPTPVQRHAIPILLAERDLMACAQTGSGKTAWNHERSAPLETSWFTDRLPSCSYPLTNKGAGISGNIENLLILSQNIISSDKTRIHDEAKKFAYQTGVKVAVAYGGTPINQQVITMHV
ncbi:unnamed protein product [Brassica oleracea]